jgi:hypothetical protein
MGSGMRLFLVIIMQFVLWSVLTAAFGTNMFRVSREPVNSDNFTQFPHIGLILIVVAIAITVFSAYILRPHKTPTLPKEGSPF